MTIICVDHKLSETSNTISVPDTLEDNHMAIEEPEDYDDAYFKKTFGEKFSLKHKADKM